MNEKKHDLFVVGRISKRERRMIFVGQEQPVAPFPGPWELRAVFAS